jgi:molybdate/tungstate transport system ATP-binding protein
MHTNTIIIMVTHDFTEANYLADRVALVHEGEIIQQGYVKDIFQHPDSIFAAQFIGVKNIFRIDDPEEFSFFGLKNSGYIGIRPENIYIDHQPLVTDYHFQGTVGNLQNNQVYMEIECCNSKRNYLSYLTINRFFELGLEKGMTIHFGFNREHLILIQTIEQP